MAVQAQYPSNVLLLKRNIQEDQDFSLQPQPSGVAAAAAGGGGGGGGVLQHSHLLFNNGGGIGNNNMNMRKRGRDVSAPIMNHPLCFHHQSQILDLSQLHSHHPSSNVVSTGLRLSSGDQQHKLHQHPPPPPLNENNLVSLSSSVFLSDDLASHIKQQRDEIDQILQTQEEELRRALAEKRERHFRELVGAAEETAARKMREKEAEMEKATRRHAELEARAARVSMEAQAWQVKARAGEARAAALQVQLQQAIMGGGAGDETAEVAEDAESAHVDPERVSAGSGPSCKACRKRVASVVLLPCRHLCVCTECDQVVRACPICRAFRNSSVQVFLS